MEQDTVLSGWNRIQFLMDRTKATFFRGTGYSSEWKNMKLKVERDTV